MALLAQTAYLLFWQPRQPGWLPSDYPEPVYSHSQPSFGLLEAGTAGHEPMRFSTRSGQGAHVRTVELVRL